jgi:hypothetical protein
VHYFLWLKGKRLESCERKCNQKKGSQLFYTTRATAPNYTGSEPHITDFEGNNCGCVRTFISKDISESIMPL